MVLGKGIKAELDKDGILTIKVDTNKDYGRSKSGISNIIATTSGNINLPGKEEIKVGINIYKPIVEDED